MIAKLQDIFNQNDWFSIVAGIVLIVVMIALNILRDSFTRAKVKAGKTEHITEVKYGQYESGKLKKQLVLVQKKNGVEGKLLTYEDDKVVSTVSVTADPRSCEKIEAITSKYDFPSMCKLPFAKDGTDNTAGLSTSYGIVTTYVLMPGQEYDEKVMLMLSEVDAVLHSYMAA